VERALVTGGGSRLANLNERLAAALRIPVDVGYAFQHLSIGKVGLDDEQLAEAEHFLSVAVGLAQGAAE
jgi:type IV pilus assembly protein PilM